MLLAAIAAMSLAMQQSPKPPPYLPEPIVLKAPIERWDEGIPLGNGMIGVLVWGGGNKINLSLDRGDLWDLRTPATFKEPGWTYANMQKLVAAKNQAELVRLFDAPYEEVPYPTKLPAGRVEIELPADFQANEFELDLKKGLAIVRGNGGQVQIYVSPKDPVIVVECSGLMKSVLIPPVGVKKLGYQPARSEADEDIHSFVQVAADQMKFCVSEIRSRLFGAGSQVMITVVSSADGDDLKRLATYYLLRSHATPGGKIEEENVSWWRKFWATSSVQIPDERLQRHYDFVRYLYGAGSRKGAPPMPLQGVWTADEGGLPPWKGDYHNDLNTQMTYLAYHAAGLTEAGETWLDFLWKLLPEFRKFAKSFYGVEGAVVPGVMTLDGKPMGGWGMYSLSPTNGAWVAQSFYLHWRYTMDRKFLKDRAYPFCKEIGLALKALLKEDPKDYHFLKLPLSSSPEIHDNSLAAWLTPNSNYDQALMDWLFGALVEMADELGLRKTDSNDWRSVAVWLGPLNFDPKTDALTLARGEPFAESHRHFSNAMAIHPLGLISVDGWEGQRKSVQATIDTILKQGTAWWCGYSFSWMACMLARAGRGEEALRYLKDYERAFTLRNGFHANGDQTKSGLSNFTYRPFTLEGNFLAMQAVQEMLLQSWGGSVRVFPAVAKEWQDCEFHDLRAEGGFKVSAKRQHGLTVWVRVEATVDSELNLRDPFAGQTPTWNRKDVKLDGPNYIVKLKKGQVLEGRASPEDP